VQEVVLGLKCLVHIGLYMINWEDLAKAALYTNWDSLGTQEANRAVKMITRY
jgi:hypothetical protein